MLHMVWVLWHVSTHTGGLLVKQLQLSVWASYRIHSCPAKWTDCTHMMYPSSREG